VGFENNEKPELQKPELHRARTSQNQTAKQDGRIVRIGRMNNSRRRVALLRSVLLPEVVPSRHEELAANGWQQ
jgi:hypothetical protein